MALWENIKWTPAQFNPQVHSSLLFLSARFVISSCYIYVLFLRCFYYFEFIWLRSIRPESKFFREKNEKVFLRFFTFAQFFCPLVKKKNIYSNILFFSNGAQWNEIIATFFKTLIILVFSVRCCFFCNLYFLWGREDKYRHHDDIYILSLNFQDSMPDFL